MSDLTTPALSLLVGAAIGAAVGTYGVPGDARQLLYTLRKEGVVTREEFLAVLLRLGQVTAGKGTNPGDGVRHVAFAMGEAALAISPNEFFRILEGAQCPRGFMANFFAGIRQGIQQLEWDEPKPHPALALPELPPDPEAEIAETEAEAVALAGQLGWFDEEDVGWAGAEADWHSAGLGSAEAEAARKAREVPLRARLQVLVGSNPRHEAPRNGTRTIPTTPARVFPTRSEDCILARLYARRDELERIRAERERIIRDQACAERKHAEHHAEWQQRCRFVAAWRRELPKS